MPVAFAFVIIYHSVVMDVDRITLFRGVFLVFLLGCLCGCAHVISKDLREAAEPGLAFREVRENSHAYQGKTVIWGGDIIETLNKRDGSTLIEVFQRSLNWRGEPTGPSEGRFLTRVESYLDPYVYRKGRRITVAGEILGEEVKTVGETDYHYPLVLARELHLWEYYYYPYSYPYYPYLWGYYDPWYPWWDYPFGWSWGFGFRYYHRRH